ncbi:uncharacterized protein PV09_05313 [Verruconis gallopava]|uniref:Zn(2)-C6 fungal-type domain-containing protein n=1 Tax=Verruconis gallopava TaxID=253628 RepID=A0A0D2AA01_9PEZI|nr:uncharacterized protein PV09_05313 [Verruconis gallopava]KIW03553.1 hypothetical protein PV09_05313 [Verruconis gallopava]
MDRGTGLASPPPSAVPAESGQAALGHSRQDSPTACIQCRHRGVQCDGTRPACHPCSGSGGECVYEPGSEQSRSAAYNAKLTELLAENASLGAILNKVTSIPQEDAKELLRQWRAGAGNAQHAESSHTTIDEAVDKTIPRESQVLWLRRPGCPPFLFPAESTFRIAAQDFLSSTSTLLHLVNPNDVESYLAEFASGIEDTPKHLLAEMAALFAAAAPFCAGLVVKDVRDAVAGTAVNLLHDVFESNPISALKSTCLLAIAFIIKKALIAMNYIDFGLRIGEANQLHTRLKPLGMDSVVWIRSKKIFRTLVFCKSWLSTTLGFLIDTPFSRSESLGTSVLEAQEGDIEDMAQMQITKMSIVKAKIFASFRQPHISPTLIYEYRAAVSQWKEELPYSMQLDNLLQIEDLRYRRILYSTHLVYLCSITLLYRCVLVEHVERSSLSARPDDNLFQASMTIAQEGCFCAIQKIRIVNLQLEEGTMLPKCWLCMFSTYVSCALLLHEAFLKLLCTPYRADVSREMEAVQMGLKILKFCKTHNDIGAHFYRTIATYTAILQGELNGVKQLITQANITEVGPQTQQFFPFQITPPGGTIIHRASRDMIRILSYPLGSTSEVQPHSARVPDVLGTAEEAVLGLHLDWMCGGHRKETKS